MSGPRIAYVINSLEGGGAALPVPAIARVLQECGARIRIFALTRRNGLALEPMLAAGLDVAVRDGGEGDHLAAARWLKQQLREWQATHLWTSLSRATILGLVLGPALGIPVISWQHNAFLKPWNRRLLRLLQSRARLWVADSASVAELSAARLGIPPERLMTWPIYAADPAMPRARPWQPGETLRIGSLGRLHPAKGYDLLIAALARLEAAGFAPPVPFEITVCGEGALAGELGRAAREAGLRTIRFAGYEARPRSFLGGLHLYLQPSRREGFCIAAHEAMTAGLPVIASATGELAHSVEPGENGWLIPPGDVEALTEALGEALADPARLQGLGEAARARVFDHFSEDRFRETGRAIFGRGVADPKSDSSAPRP